MLMISFSLLHLPFNLLLFVRHRCVHIMASDRAKKSEFSSLTYANNRADQMVASRSTPFCRWVAAKWRFWRWGVALRIELRVMKRRRSNSMASFWYFGIGEKEILGYIIWFRREFDLLMKCCSGLHSSGIPSLKCCLLNKFQVWGDSQNHVIICIFQNTDFDAWLVATF